MARVTYGPQGSVKVVRSFHPARVTGIGDNSHFTVVTYKGSHANEVFVSPFERPQLMYKFFMYYRLSGMTFSNTQDCGKRWTGFLQPYKFDADNLKTS